MVELSEALGWVGYRVDDVYGAHAGKVEDVYVDESSGAPVWMLVRLGRFGDDHVLVPVAGAVGNHGHVWVPYERQQIKAAPLVAPRRLGRERDLASARHYRLSDRQEMLAARAADDATAELAGARTGVIAL